jgi:hypothetical protein
MKIKTNELTGAALDWAVAKAENASPDTGWLLLGVCWYKRDEEGVSHLFQPSTNWSQGGPIIGREWIKLFPNVGGAWSAQIRHTKSHPLVAYKVIAGWTNAAGPSPLIAAMRCYVASKLGGAVDVPEGVITP